MVKLGIYGTVYNSADTVRTTIEDLKKKLKYDFVISVCDNYSKDGTFEILKEYDFVDAFQKKSTRGLGRQYALENLIKNHPDVDYIFYIDFDVIFPEYFNDFINGAIKIYKERSFIGSFASYETYKELLKKARWRDMNVAEDFMFGIDIIKAGFDLYFAALPLSLNQERQKREKKYAKGLKYIERMFKIYFKDLLMYKYLKTMVKFNSIRDPEIILHSHLKDILLPTDFGLNKDLLFLIIPYHSKYFEKIKKKLAQYYDYVYLYKTRRQSFIKYFFIIFYNYNTVKSYVNNYFRCINRNLNENFLVKINLR